MTATFDGARSPRAERDAARADLARVTAERDACRAALASLRAAVVAVFDTRAAYNEALEKRTERLRVVGERRTYLDAEYMRLRGIEQNAAIADTAAQNALDAALAALVATADLATAGQRVIEEAEAARGEVGAGPLRRDPVGRCARVRGCRGGARA